MTHWNYRIVRCREPGFAGYFYGLFEVYYDDDGNPVSRTEEPASFACGDDEGPAGIRDSLALALKDATERPVLDEERDFGGKTARIRHK